MLFKNLEKAKHFNTLKIKLKKQNYRKKELRFESDELVGKIATQREERQRVLDRIDDVQIKLDEFVQEQKNSCSKTSRKN